MPDEQSPEFKPTEPVKATDGHGAQSAETGDKYAALRQRVLRSQNDTGTVAEALGRRNFLLALVWVALLALAFTFEQLKTRWEYFTVEQKNRRTADLEEGDRQEVVTETGLKYTDIKLGAGPMPAPGDLILLDYQLSLPDGTQILSSQAPGQKALGFTFGPVSRVTLVTPGLMEGIATMHKGGKRHLVVPPALGFGDRPVFFETATIPANSTLIYDVELVKVSIAPS